VDADVPWREDLPHRPLKPLWAKNCPRFGIAHALCLGLAPWLAAEVPILVDSGMVKHKDDEAAPAEASGSASSAAS
jgi:ufm1-conjugating enzyme 1